jgi:hypothetical protein
MNQQERDDAILEHLRRFHLTTAEVLHRLFFPGSKLNAVRKITSRLIREKKIRAWQLFEQRKYFTLSPGQAARMGEDRSIGTPFQHQGLVNAYGVLLFAIETGTQPFTKKEFEAKFPELVIRGVIARNYYVDREPTDGHEPSDGSEPGGAGVKNRLGFILVDYGTSPLTIRKKVHHITARAYTLPAFAKLIHGDHFVIGIATPSPAKAGDIRAVLEDDGPGNVRYRIVPCPELGEYLMNRGRLRRPKADSAGEATAAGESDIETLATEAGGGP